VDHNRFLQLMNKFIATKAMRVERNNFRELRAAVVFVQQRFLENFYTPEPVNVHSHPWLLSSRALPGIDDTRKSGGEKDQQKYIKVIQAV